MYWNVASISCFFLVHAVLLSGIVASTGDRDIVFNKCVIRCLRWKNHTSTWYLRLLHWNKDSNCKYDCMHEISGRRKRANLKILQYYGKWPFKRFYGIQEPASFGFSLLNIIGNIIGWGSYRNRVDKNSEFYTLTRMQFLINVNGWFCACLFHTRDIDWTEKLDYFSASLIIAISVFACISRIIGKLDDPRTYFFGVVIIILFGYHISYMALIRLDYGYNMKFMVCIGLLNISLWLIWCILHHSERKHVWKCALTMGGAGILASLELLDFPPIWWIFDGHALWHLGTAPLSFLWYSFLIDDAIFIKKQHLKLM